MIKPNWALFFLAKPDRFIVTTITLVFVMITFTLYGEGTRREKLEKETKITPKTSTVPTLVPVPTPDK
jgi:hypothetical protein